MSEIQYIGGNFPSIDEIVQSINDADTAKEAVDSTEKLKKLLEVAEQYGQYASQFCLMEAETFIRIAKIPNAEKKLKSSKKRIVEWLRQKTPHGLDRIRQACADGRRIHLVMKDELRKERDDIYEMGADKEYARIQGIIVTELEQTGKTRLSPQRFIEKWRLLRAPSAATVKAYVESTRDKLLHMDGRGIGDGDGTYVLPSKCDRQQIAAVVSIRLRSIAADLNSLCRLCSENSFKVPPEGIEILEKAVKGLEYDDD